MKTLLLVRHAKSSHDFLSSDFDRPLNERGLRDAALMGKRLTKNAVPIDRFISSPALRAKTTAEIFAAAYDRKKKEIQFVPSLYNASSESFKAAISSFDDFCDCIAIFSHNPGITEFASSLTNTHIENMPTSSVFAVRSPIDSWKDFDQGKKEFLFFMDNKE
jgi:phosphohistidine phosphatase